MGWDPGNGGRQIQVVIKCKSAELQCSGLSVQPPRLSLLHLGQTQGWAKADRSQGPQREQGRGSSSHRLQVPHPPRRESASGQGHTSPSPACCLHVWGLSSSKQGPRPGTPHPGRKRSAANKASREWGADTHPWRSSGEATRVAKQGTRVPLATGPPSPPAAEKMPQDAASPTQPSYKNRADGDASPSASGEHQRGRGRELELRGRQRGKASLRFHLLL